ncbi:hypothetical protein MMC30_007868 [Trapelia coarctata]|nr:hypothetical protein [Trapelia coarctata]
MGDLSNFEVGQTVELQDGRIATVRFVGNTHFAAGDWIGVELDDTSGKNDGSVQGQRYFDCEPGRGMFLRPATATVIDQPTPRPIKKTNGVAARSRQSVVGIGTLKRQSVLDSSVNKRQSINRGSPTPSGKSTNSSLLLRSPSKSPTKQLGSRPPSGTASSRQSQPPSVLKSSTIVPRGQGGIAGRPSIGAGPSATSRPPRQSTLGSLNGAVKPSLSASSLSSTRGLANRLNTLQQAQKRSNSLSESSQTSGGSGHASPSETQSRGLLSPNSETHGSRPGQANSPALSRASATSRAVASPNSASSRAGVSPGDAPRQQGSAPPPSTVLSREVEDLKTKLRIIEKKRLEDRDKLKVLEKIQCERDKFEGIIQKLQAKYQPQQQEIAELRRQIKEAEAKGEANEHQQADNEAALEMATLDREMAEETAEAMKAELDSLRQRHEELELEVEILREENMELGKEMSPEEKTSQGWMQMERSNERLREALLRLRDMTQEQEAVLKDQVNELEADVKELGKYPGLYQDVKEKLAHSEATIEDLRQQLETALGAEEMIEELTEKNLSLQEQIDELKMAIEDLESLKEINDELEVNHVETEKQMQDEIDYQETIVQEQIRKSGAQDEAIQDLEYTVSRFRELVTNLQSDLEDMRASQQITESEANELSSRSKAMLDLNLRLQVSASKAQVKAIDLELERLQAQESAEHLAIVQLFLPDVFANERDSVNALLRFKRIGFKASLLHTFVKERTNNPTIPGREEDLFACCDILDKLTWILTMCDRFVQFIYSSSLEAFERLGSALYDLDPVERALNSWIDGLKRDELKEQQCATELQRSIALMTHLAEVHIPDGLQQYAEDVYMRILVMVSNLENAALALSTVKAIAQSKVSHCGDDDQQEPGMDEVAESFFRKADSLMLQIRSAKVVSGKAVHQIQELKSRSLTLDPSTLPAIEQSQTSTLELVIACRQSGLALAHTLNEEGRSKSLTGEEVIKAISPTDSSPLFALSTKSNIAATQMQSLYTLTTTLSQTIEFSSSAVPPWEAITAKIRAVSTTSASHEKEVGRLKDELSEKNTALAMKDKVVEEMSVNVEVLEKRVNESGGRRERLRELEGLVDSSTSREKETAAKLARLEQDLKALEAERQNWKKQNHQTRIPSGSHGGLSGAQDEAVSAKALEETVQLKAEIAMLQATIRHLRLSSYQNTLNNSSTTFLSDPLLPKPKPTKRAHLAHEAKDVLQSMLAFVTQPENQVVRLQPLGQGARLGWRPAKETPQWQVGRQREEWEVWRDWRDDVSKRGNTLSRDEVRKKAVEKEKRDVLAGVGFHIPGLRDKGSYSAREVRIADPGNWEELQATLGIA